jgi:hypothetical protein
VLKQKGETMKDVAIEAAESLKAAAETLGFPKNTDQYFTFVNSQFAGVYGSLAYLQQVERQQGPTAAAEAATAGAAT